MNVRGTWFDKSGDANERGFDGSTASVLFGGDYRISDQFVVGALFSYENTDSTFDPILPTGPITLPTNSGGTESNSYIFMLFGSFNLSDAWWVDGSVGGGFSSHTFTRNGTFQLSDRTLDLVGTPVRAVGTPDGSEVSLSAGTGYDWHSGAFSTGPYMRFNYVRSEIDGYTETDTLGTGLNLIVDSNTRTSFTSVLGLRGSYVISTGLGVVVPQLRVEWEHEYDRIAQVSSVIFANDTAGTPLEVPFTGSNPDRDYANVGASVMMVLQGGWMPFIEYEGIFGYANLTRHRLTGGLRQEF